LTNVHLVQYVQTKCIGFRYTNQLLVTGTQKIIESHLKCSQQNLDCT